MISFKEFLQEEIPKEKWLDANFRARWYKLESKTKSEIIEFLERRIERLEFEKKVLLKMLKKRFPL